MRILGIIVLIMMVGCNRSENGWGDSDYYPDREHASYDDYDERVYYESYYDREDHSRNHRDDRSTATPNRRGGRREVDPEYKNHHNSTTPKEKEADRRRQTNRNQNRDRHIENHSQQ